MKILFVVTNTYPPQTYGGIRTSTDQLCLTLMKKGHKTAALTSMCRGGLFAFKTLVKMKLNMKFKGHKVARDTGLGYPVWRTWFPLDEIEYVVNKEKPDVIVMMGGNVVEKTLAAKPTGVPVLTQVHDVVFHLHDASFKAIKDIPCVANSKFTAEKYRTVHGIDCIVIYPFISFEKYRTNTTRENITLINLQLHKGTDIALQIARACPDIPFSFVESLPLRGEYREKVIKEVANLPNITMLPPQKDMRKIYGKCKILLAPSIWEEAYGRVATEAQISGIPVIASNRGGLPESVGPGGILLDPEGPIENWINAVRKLWQDEQYYAELSEAALVYAQRPEMDFNYQIDAHEKALLEAAGKSSTVP